MPDIQISAADAASRALEVFDTIHSPVGHVTTPDALAAVYGRLCDDWAMVSELWNPDEPCVPFWTYRMLKRFGDFYQAPLRAWLADDLAA